MVAPHAVGSSVSPPPPPSPLFSDPQHRRAGNLSLSRQLSPRDVLHTNLSCDSLSLCSRSSFSPPLLRRARASAASSPSDGEIPDSTSSELGDADGAWWLPLLELLSTAFPVWVALGCAMGIAKPQAFYWIKGGWQVLGLAITMLGMGMTLSFKDFGAAFAMPKELLAGVVLQYTVMPTAGALISRFMQLPPYYAAGLVLVSCCPGGTASNIVTYLARGNVALSVMMTTASTFLAVAMTPFLTAKLAGQYVAVDASALFTSTLQVVLLPVLAGVAMAHYYPKLVNRISPFAPLVAIITVAALCASAVAQNAAAILSSGGQVIVAVLALHAAGFLFGYLLSRIAGFQESTARTISIEVGMQNSVLGVVLANQHFSNPLTAVPCAISSVCHSVVGSLLAALWRVFGRNNVGSESVVP